MIYSVREISGFYLLIFFFKVQGRIARNKQDNKKKKRT